MVLLFLGAFGAALVLSAVCCVLALRLFPWFRSGERKEGAFRADQSSGNFSVKEDHVRKKVRLIANTNELPLVGGVAMVIGVIGAAIAGGIALNISLLEWLLLGVLLAATVGYALVGFVDDWRKVHHGEGISEIQKFVGVLLISLAAAVALNRLDLPEPLNAKFAYSPYKDAPGFDLAFRHIPHFWPIFFVLLTVTVACSTSLAVDFSDGLDGLCGGLVLSSALSFAAILLGEGVNALNVPTLVTLALAGAVVGYLPFNWPSSWKARGMGSGQRNARLIMGDTGSLALGGLLALVAVITKLEIVLIFIGGVFVLEGLSALIQARVMVKFFRRSLALQRFGGKRRGFPHTEFPLPFLATPMHYHFDLLGWDRRRLVYGAWFLGAGLGVLGVASTIGAFTWERYLARLAALGVMILVWQSGPWTRKFFIGLAYPSGPAGAKKGETQYLALYYGSPYKFLGRRLFSQVDITQTPAETLTNPAETLTLWQRMNGFDARALLGYYCYRADQLDDAYRVWHRIPKVNLAQRPQIEELLAEVRHTLALRAEPNVIEEIMPAVVTVNRSGEREISDPAATTPGGARLQRPDDEEPTAQVVDAALAAVEDVENASVEQELTQIEVRQVELDDAGGDDPVEPLGSVESSESSGSIESLRVGAVARSDPHARAAATAPDDSGAAWRTTMRPATGLRATRLEPAPGAIPPLPQRDATADGAAHDLGAHTGQAAVTFWSVGAWTTAQAGSGAREDVAPATAHATGYLAVPGEPEPKSVALHPDGARQAQAGHVAPRWSEPASDTPSAADAGGAAPALAPAETSDGTGDGERARFTVVEPQAAFQPGAEPQTPPQMTRGADTAPLALSQSAQEPAPASRAGEEPQTDEQGALRRDASSASAEVAAIIAEMDAPTKPRVATVPVLTEFARPSSSSDE